MGNLDITSEDYQEYFLLYVKMKHKAVDVSNDIIKEVMGLDESFNPDKDMVEFVLDKIYESDEDGEIDVLKFSVPSVIIRKYIESEKTHKIYMDFPVSWLREDVDHVEVADAGHHGAPRPGRSGAFPRWGRRTRPSPIVDSRSFPGRASTHAQQGRKPLARVQRRDLQLH